MKRLADSTCEGDAHSTRESLLLVRALHFNFSASVKPLVLAELSKVHFQMGAYVGERWKRSAGAARRSDRRTGAESRHCPRADRRLTASASTDTPPTDSSV